VGDLRLRCHATLTSRVDGYVEPLDDEQIEVFADGRRLLVQRCLANEGQPHRWRDVNKTPAEETGR
jgi:hypothetical protein